MEKKSGKIKYIIIIVILTILAAGGVGFGVYEYLNRGCENVQTSEEENQTQSKPSNYLYFGEYGIKFKIPSSLYDWFIGGYSYYYGGSGADSSFTISLRQEKDDVTNHQIVSLIKTRDCEADNDYKTRECLIVDGLTYTISLQIDEIEEAAVQTLSQELGDVWKALTDSSNYSNI